MSQPTNTYNQKWIDGGQTYVVKSEDNVLNIRTGLGATTIYLPLIRDVSYSQRVLTINDTDGQASANPITLVRSPQGANLINGSGTLELKVNQISAKILIVNNNEYLANLSTDNSEPIPPPSDDFVKLETENYIFVEPVGTPTENGTALRTAWLSAQLLTPNGNALSSINRAVVYVLAGHYDLQNTNLIIGQYVDLIGIGNPDDILIQSSGSRTLNISATNDYRLMNVTISASVLSMQFQNGSTDNGIIDNIVLNAPTSTGITHTFQGKYTNIVCKTDFCFGGNVGNLALFQNCIFQDDSCARGSSGVTTTIEGKIINCIGGDRCFGRDATSSVIISGLISGCFSGDGSFGSAFNGVTISGTIRDCIATGNGNSFGYSDTVDVTISGLLDNCITNDAFGDNFGKCNNGTVTISGIIRNCRTNSTNENFGHSGGGAVTISGSLYNCIGGAFSYGYTSSGNVSLTGYFYNCRASDYSFGSMNNSGSTISLSGKFYDCVSGSFSFGHSINSGSSNISNALFSNCTGGSQCFGYSSNSLVTCDNANIIGCSATDESFVRSINGGVSFTNSLISNCKSGDNSFARTVNGNLTFTGKISDCIGGNYSFCSSDTSTYTMAGSISDCKGLSYCFANCASTFVTITGIISNCEGVDYCFGRSNSNPVDLYGTISNCIGNNYCFVTTENAPPRMYGGIISDCRGNDYCFLHNINGGFVLSSGAIRDCTARDFSFLICSNGNCSVSLEGIVDNCNARNSSFFTTLSSGIMTINGTIKNCTSVSGGFNGNTQTNFTGKLVNCYANTDNILWYGVIDSCTFFIDSVNPIVKLATLSTVKYSTLLNIGAGEVIDSFDLSTSVTPRIYQSSFNKVANITRVTNIITTPYNVVDTNLIY